VTQERVDGCGHGLDPGDAVAERGRGLRGVPAVLDPAGDPVHLRVERRICHDRAQVREEALGSVLAVARRGHDQPADRGGLQHGRLLAEFVRVRDPGVRPRCGDEGSAVVVEHEPYGRDPHRRAGTRRPRAAQGPRSH
jgi:hypothetical protein